MPEALGDDQAERADLALQQRVGRDRRAVREPGEVIWRVARLARIARTPRTSPIAGLAGVLATLVGPP